MSPRTYNAPIRPEGERTWLIRGTLMMCPRCKRDHNVLEYKSMQEIPEHQKETMPVSKCPSCGWAFTLVDTGIKKLMRGEVDG